MDLSLLSGLVENGVDMLRLPLLGANAELTLWRVAAKLWCVTLLQHDGRVFVCACGTNPHKPVTL